MSIITEHLGKLEGLVTLLRAVPYNASLRRVYLLQNIMMEKGVSTEQVVASLHASLRRPTTGNHGGSRGLNRTVVASYALHVSLREVYLTQDIMMEHGVSTEQVR